MTPASVGALAPRLILGRALRELRGSRPLAEVARAVEVSTATWSRVELGESPVHSPAVERACAALHVTDEELIEYLVGLAKQTKSKGWLTPYGDVVSDNTKHFLTLEASAEKLRWFEHYLVPGLLQAPAYVRALMAADGLTGWVLPPGGVERRIELRAHRQKILTQESGATQLDAIIDESALRRMLGGPAAMIEQLVHLLGIGERDNVTIRVMTHEHDHAGIATGHFILMDFPLMVKERRTLPPTVYIDGYFGFVLSEEPSDVELCQTAWANMLTMVLDEDQTRDFLRHRIHELQQLA